MAALFYKDRQEKTALTYYTFSSDELTLND